MLTGTGAVDFAIIPAPFGSIEIRAAHDRVIGVDVFPEEKSVQPPVSPVLRELARQLEQYFEDPRSVISAPFAWPSGAHQRRVHQALSEIPAGQVRSYGELARLLGSGARAVAGACRRNPIPLIIPCHRVVASNHLGGYCGQVEGPYLAIKRWLLQHEAHARD